MAVIVATRMKVRRTRDLPRFLLGSLAAAHQARHAPGYLGGRFRAEPGRVFWTLTVWESGQHMTRYRDTGAHASLVPKIGDWACEAAFGVWNDDHTDLPAWTEASQRLAEHPHFATLDHPTPAHSNSQAVAAHHVGLDLPTPRKQRPYEPQPTRP